MQASRTRPIFYRFNAKDKNKIYKPKCCIKYDADMLKNLCKATKFDYDTHEALAKVLEVSP